MDKTTKLLRGVHLFDILTDEEVRIFSDYTRIEKFSEGANIFKKGESSNAFYIVEQGEVRIVKDAFQDKDNTLAFFIEGEIFGEFDLFENDPRTATAITNTPSSLLIFPRGGYDFEYICNKHPDIFVKIYHSLITVNSGRIRQTNRIITEKSSWLNDLKEQMYKDKLTNFYNQSYLDDEFPRLLKEYEKTAFLVVKPDDFKIVNDTFGHEAGDMALKAIAGTVLSAIGETEIPIRFRGNEFIIAFCGKSAEETEERARAIFKQLSDIDIGALIGEKSLFLTYSMGLAEYPEQGETVDTVTQLAYSKMFEQRDNGGNGIRIVDSHIDNLIPFLQKVSVFSSLYISELQILSGYMKHVNYGEGSYICREGEEGSELFIIESGTATASIKIDDNEEKILTEFTTGDFFGEVAIFENAQRSASIIAREESSLLTLDKQDFLAIMEKWPMVAIKMMKEILDITSGRLSHTSSFISEMVKWGDNASRRAITDELTGVYNRRYLDSALEDHFEKSRKHKKSLSVIMADMDFFRDVNESYSHETGDRYIVEVASVFQKCLRESDIIARYGGDEFTILLPETEKEKAMELAESIRATVEQLDFLKNIEGPDLPLSVSLGLAVFPNHCTTLDDLKKLADEALYRAKESGRNKVVAADN